MGKLAEFNTETDLLPYFCMTNVHKFVTINRVGKAGPQNRKWIDKDCELAFLKAELKALKPTIVVFQEPADGNLSDRQVEDLKQSLLKQSHDGCTIIRLQHPATRKKGGYRLKEDIEMKIDKALPKALNG